MRIRVILAGIALLVVACLGPAAIPKTQTPPPILPTASLSTQAPSTIPPTALPDTPVLATTSAAAIPNTQATPAVGQGPRILNGHTDAVASVAWSPDGKQLASGSIDRTVKVWDAASGKPQATLTDHTTPVFSVAWSPDGKKLASGYSDGSLLWRLFLETVS